MTPATNRTSFSRVKPEAMATSPASTLGYLSSRRATNRFSATSQRPPNSQPPPQSAATHQGCPRIASPAASIAPTMA